MSRTITKNELGDLLAPYSPEVRSLALSTRTFLLEMIPGAIQVVDAGSKVVGYGFGTGYKDSVCSLMPTKAGVTLGIAWGAELPDPHRIMEGAGKVHRHVKLKGQSDLKSPALNALLKAALQATIVRRKKAAIKS
jgi:hypothetical protein